MYLEEKKKKKKETLKDQPVIYHRKENVDIRKLKQKLYECTTLRKVCRKKT